MVSALLLLRQGLSDLPIHCLMEDVNGDWNIALSVQSGEVPGLFDTHLQKFIGTSDFVVTLTSAFHDTQQSPITALELVLDAATNRPGVQTASWSMIYDEGVVIQLVSDDSTIILYGQFEYEEDPKFQGLKYSWVRQDGSTPGYVSNCNKIPRGWAIHRDRSGTTTSYFVGTKAVSRREEGGRSGWFSWVPWIYETVANAWTSGRRGLSPVTLLNENLPSEALKQTSQGDCGSCFVLAFAHAFEVTLKRKLGGLSQTTNGGSLEPDHAHSFSIKLDREAMLSCSYSSQGCNGGYYQSLALDLMVTGIPVSGCMDTDLHRLSSRLNKAQQCDAHCYKDSTELYYPAGFVELRTQERIEEWIREVGPVPVAINLPNSPVVGMVEIDNTVKGSWNFVTHGVVILGWGQEGGVPFWEVYNPWGGEMGLMKIRRSERDGVLEQYALGIKVDLCRGASAQSFSSSIQCN